MIIALKNYRILCMALSINIIIMKNVTKTDENVWLK